MLVDKLALFPTHIYRFSNPAAAADHEHWRQAIYELRRRDAGRTLSNHLGWQSSAPLATVPQLEGLARFIVACLMEIGRAEGWQLEYFGFVIDGWANINGKGAGNSFHSHPNCFVSGCYYLDTPPGSGDILFRDPREVAYNYQPPYADGRLKTPVKAFTPAPGMLLAFPPWLLHAVDPNMSDADRVSVAFNAVLERRPPGR